MNIIFSEAKNPQDFAPKAAEITWNKFANIFILVAALLVSALTIAQIYQTELIQDYFSSQTLALDLFPYFSTALTLWLWCWFWSRAHVALGFHTPLNEQIKNLATLDITDHLSAGLWRALAQSYDFAQSKQRPLSPLFLLWGLSQRETIEILVQRLGLSGDILRQAIETEINLLPPLSQTPNILPSETLAIIYEATNIAIKTKDEAIFPAHLVLALANAEELKNVFLRLKLPALSLARVAQWFTQNATTMNMLLKLRRHNRFKPKGPINQAWTSSVTKYLDQYSDDLTARAKAGYLPLAFGRTELSERIFHLIEGGARGVILSGEGGVGKTSIFNGLAYLMLADDVPPRLLDKRLVALNFSTLIAGAGPGQFEERLLTALAEAQHAGNIILILENIDQLVGASLTGIDFSATLAQLLESGGFILLASTSPKAYAEKISRSPLSSILEKVDVPEMTFEETLAVLQAKANLIENRTPVYFLEPSLEEAITLSQRFIADKKLPEKAISLIEEAGQIALAKNQKINLVTGEDMATVITKRTGVPTGDPLQSEAATLVDLENKLHEKVIGQEPAVSAVARALRRARTELRDQKRPMANFLFLGPTGVGKTELAKALAQIYFHTVDSFIRLDMSEYQEVGSLRRLLGALPGSGDNSGGQLSEALRAHPFSLVLLDELEKAHPDILNVFLQIFDDGRMTDNQGQVIDCTNAIFIATSNAGSQEIFDGVKNNLPYEQIRQQLLNQVLKNYYSPEFLNRFDDIIIFSPLSENELLAVTKIQLQKLTQTLADKSIALEVTPAALQELARRGYDPALGARPLRRVIQNTVEDELTQLLLAQAVNPRDTVLVKGDLTLEIKHPA